MTHAELDSRTGGKPPAAASTPETTDVQTDDGVRLTVSTWPACSADAPVVLALHGITANRLAFLPLIDALDGAATVIAFDARGRGRSDKPTDEGRYGIRRHADDAACVLRALDVGPVVVVGQSMGGWISAQLAAHYPDLVTAVVLGDGGYFLDLPSGCTPMAYVNSVMGEGWVQRVEAVLPSRETAMTIFKSAPPFRDLWDANLEAMLNEGLEDLPDGSVHGRCVSVSAVSDSLDYFRLGSDGVPYLRADLALLRSPVHLVRAPRGFELTPELSTPVMPEEAVAEFRRTVPQLTVETVEDTNHYTVNFGPRGVAAIAAAVRRAFE
jgi:pimeloyl-ACP methyl ester carboxylesterase